MTQTLTNTQIAEGMVAAMRDGDMDTLLSFLTPDVVVVEPNALPYSGKWQGHDGFQALLGKLLSRLELELHGAEVFDGTDTFAARLDVTFTSRASGRAIRTRIVEVDTVVNGLVTHIDVFYKDPDLIAELFAEGRP